LQRGLARFILRVPYKRVRFVFVGNLAIHYPKGMVGSVENGMKMIPHPVGMRPLMGVNSPRFGGIPPGCAMRVSLKRETIFSSNHSKIQ